MRSSHEPLKARMLHQNLSEHSNIKEPQLTKYVNQQNIRLILGIRSGFLEPKLASKQYQHTKENFRFTKNGTQLRQTEDTCLETTKRIRNLRENKIQTERVKLFF